MSKENILRLSSWILVTTVTSLALFVWAGERLDGRELTAYTVFPLLGILAFSLMWTHYIVGWLRRRMNLGKQVVQLYSKTTAMIVLFLLLLHPGILIVQLYRDGFGLPPQSYLTVYTEPVMKGAIMLGTLSLLIFLAFELKKRYAVKSWWQYIEYAQVLAMVLIFYHGLMLGRELSVDWFRLVWFGYGISFVAAVLYNYWYDKKGR